MILGFLNDPAMYSNTNPIHRDIASAAGYLDDYADDYFVTPALITDKRSSRLTIFANPAIEKQSFVFDEVHVAEAEDFSGAPVAEVNRLLNVMETAFLTQNKTVEQINSTLNAAVSDYEGYQYESLSRAASVVNARIALTDNSFLDITVPNWIQFDFRIHEKTLTFKIWIGLDAFKTEYPNSNITKVIFPFAASKMVSAAFPNVTEAIVESNTYLIQKMNEEMQARENTGAMLHGVEYNHTSVSGDYELPFCVMYKGAAPSPLGMKNAIRDALNEVPGIEQNTWVSLFPSLFTSNEFFVMPIWDNTTVLPTFILDKSIIDLQHILNKVREIWPSWSVEHINNYVEILTVAGAEIILAVIPHPDNTLKTLGTVEHRTYQAISTTDPDMDKQEDHTREFGIQLNKCIAKLQGSTNDATFSDSVIDNKAWLSFDEHFVSYHVLKKESYPQ